MGSRLRYVFRSFPRDPLDEKSEGSAEAAESAGAQGKFWAIHDRLFENQGAFTRLELAKHAGAVGLDARQFRREMRGHVHLARVFRPFLGLTASSAESHLAARLQSMPITLRRAGPLCRDWKNHAIAPRQILTQLDV